jgi:DNA repair exonuclease SbcCD ATPase subunit
MHVDSLTMKNLLNHDETVVELPECGLVVVTGDNGAGKSSMPECVAVACWGKTLRGSVPWRDGVKAEAAVEAGGLLMERTKTAKGSPKLHWTPTEGTPQKRDTFPTTTKAQEALEHRIGPFDVWRRSHVFSSSDAAHFTTATDATRKRLLEALLGLDQFDAALADCRGDLRTAESKYAAIVGELNNVSAHLEGAGRRREDAEQALAALGQQPTGQLDLETEAGLKDTEGHISNCSNDIWAMESTLQEEHTLLGEAAATVRQFRAAGESVKAGTCPTCLQVVGEAQLKAAKEKFRAKEDDANAVYARCAKAEAELSTELEDLKEEMHALQSQQTVLVAKREREAATLAQRERWKATKAKLDETIGSAKSSEAALKKKAKKLTKDRDVLADEVATLKAVEKVLGLKGVRAHVLGTALGGLEQMGNLWLAKLRRSDLQVQLKPYAESKKGNVSDAISLDVVGAGGGHGYKASSGGERRRIDVALVFALAEVSAASRAQEVGTLWFDEVFDCLDGDGVEAVCCALDELAQERCVVVITHSAELAGRLDAVLRLHVAKGRVAA